MPAHMLHSYTGKITHRACSQLMHYLTARLSVVCKSRYEPEAQEETLSHLATAAVGDQTWDAVVENQWSQGK